MEKLLSHFGAQSDTDIILYDDYQSADAARLWWLLKFYGHDKVSILDGGLKKWSALGYKYVLMPPSRTKASGYRFTGEPHLQYLANLADVKEAYKNPKVVILDVRSREEFSGRKRKSGAHRAGRIPDSLWFAYSQTVNKNGFLDQEKLQKLFSRKGIISDTPVIIYCQSGVRSAQTLFVLTQLLGFKNVRNYDGSWIEWSLNHDLPVAKGGPNIALDLK